MKRNLYSSLIVLLTGLLFTGCSDNDYMDLDKGHDTLQLTASQTTEELNEATHGSEALTLSWTTGTNHGSGHRISYTLELAPSGSDFAASPPW